MTFTSTMDTPIGPFTAVVDTDGAVLAAGWTAQPDDLLPLIAPGCGRYPWCTAQIWER